MGSAPPTGHYSVKLVDNIEAPQPFFPEGFNPIGPVPRVDSKLLCESQIQVLARNLANEIAAHNLSRSHANHLLALLMTLERDLLKQEATIKWLNRKLDSERDMRLNAERELRLNNERGMHTGLQEAADANAFESVSVPFSFLDELRTDKQRRDKILMKQEYFWNL